MVQFPRHSVQQFVRGNPWLTVRNLLVMRLDNIGDVIMTSPVLRSLKENLPQARLTLMASPGGSLVAPLLPWVDEVLTWRVLWQDLGRLEFDPAREWRLVSELRERQFDAAIILTSFNQSPHPPALLCSLAGIPLRVGESKEKGGNALTTEVSSAPDRIHQVERNLGLIEAIDFEVCDRSLAIQIPEEAHQTATSLLSQHRLSTNDPFLLLNPWTSCQSRNYPADRFAIAARQLSEITGWKVVVTGVEKDRSHSGELLKILGESAIDLIGATDLSTLAALVQRSKLMLSNNTSTMHIADATRTPSVILFAGTELESQWQPRDCRSILLRQPTPCSPCYAFTCPYHLECLDIVPDRVVKAGLELLGL
ncbi:glycosyltransferase family 9 protein [Phormidesmis priestleyi]